jgi:hypothetical protein
MYESHQPFGLLADYPDVIARFRLQLPWNLD